VNFAENDYDISNPLNVTRRSLCERVVGCCEMGKLIFGYRQRPLFSGGPAKRRSGRVAGVRVEQVGSLRTNRLWLRVRLHSLHAFNYETLHPLGREPFAHPPRVNGALWNAEHFAKFRYGPRLQVINKGHLGQQKKYCTMCNFILARHCTVCSIKDA
jgi:hypothetical protein